VLSSWNEGAAKSAIVDFVATFEPVRSQSIPIRTRRRTPTDPWTYFGPNAPAGKESNWIYTEPGTRWFAYFRFYGPDKPVFDKTWKLNDIEPFAAQ
jgi:hypothetical protein